MRIKIKEQDSVIVVSVDSSVLQEHIPVFRERLNSLIDDKKYWIVFDMFSAQYLSSMGIAVILNVKKKANEFKGDVVFANVNHLVMNLFEVTKLLKKLDIYDSVDKAVAGLKNKMP